MMDSPANSSQVAAHQHQSIQMFNSSLPQSNQYSNFVNKQQPTTYQNSTHDKSNHQMSSYDENKTNNAFDD